jgi:SOS response regulatory protein OraA/RecX
MTESELGSQVGESEIMSVVMRRLNAAPRSRGELTKYLLAKDFDPTLIENGFVAVSDLADWRPVF